MKFGWAEMVVLACFALLGWLNYQITNLVPTGWIPVAAGLIVFLLVSGIWFRDIFWSPGAYFDKDENLVGIFAVFGSVLLWFVGVVAYGLCSWLWPGTWVLVIIAGEMWLAFSVLAMPVFISYYFSIRCGSEQLESSA